MAKKIAVEMKDRIFSGKEQMSKIAFLQEFKSAWNACGIHKSAAIWLLKQYLVDPAGAVENALLTLPNSANVYHESALKSYSTIV